MYIRKAKETDLAGINSLLQQVLLVHHQGRPDLFKAGGKKYTDEEILRIIAGEETPVFVAVDEKENLLGYAFCIFKQLKKSEIMTDIKSLYIDDLCVDEKQRGLHIGTQLLEYVTAFAKESGCYNITLNVWSCNESAMKFYEKSGLVPQKVGMEKIL